MVLYLTDRSSPLTTLRLRRRREASRVASAHTVPQCGRVGQRARAAGELEGVFTTSLVSSLPLLFSSLFHFHAVSFHEENCLSARRLDLVLL